VCRRASNVDGTHRAGSIAGRSPHFARLAITVAELSRPWRDLRLRPLHVFFLLASGAGAVALAFQAGYRAGRADVTFLPASSSGRVDGAGQGELIDLLSRVEAGATPDGGASRLTFPTALRNGAPADVGPLPPTVADAPAGAAAGSIPPTPEGIEGGDPVPSTPWVVEAGRFGAPEPAAQLRDHLRGAGLAASATLQLVEGVRTWVVLVPGGADEAAAKDVVSAVEVAEDSADVEVAAPFAVGPSD
jgi:hypothetical protein